MNTLPYDNAAALIRAFKQGTKFKLVYPGRPEETVTEVSLYRDDTLKVVGALTGSWYTFQPDGSSSISDVFKMVPVPAPEPLLKRLVMGETFHVPKTRETLVSFTFEQNTLRVLLQAEDGSYRNSTNYDHQGRHKWVPERSLEAGAVPVLPKVEKTYRAEELSSAPKGVYLALDGDNDHVVVSGRHVTFIGQGRVEPFRSNAWDCMFRRVDKTFSIA